jgi:hypothetical protein
MEQPTTTPKPRLFSKETTNQVLLTYKTLIAGSVTLICSLSWHEAFKGLFAPGGLLSFMPNSGPWYYALFITCVGAIILRFFDILEKRRTLNTE